jgi:hypothetical protein
MGAMSMQEATRRSHQCHRDGCDSEAVWQMFVRFTTRTPSGTLYPMLAQSSITVCDAHRKDAAESFLTPRNLDTFAAGLERQNLACPHPNSINFEFGRIPRERSVIEVRTDEPAKVIRCDRAECINPAKWQIALKVWNIGQTKSRSRPLRILLGLCVCQRHRQESTVKNVLLPEGKSKLLGVLTECGIPMPDFRSAELVFLTMDEVRKVDPVTFSTVGAE